MRLFYNTTPSKIKLKKPYWTGFDNLWEQTSLPLGNGSLGMGIMGEIKKDTIILNHKTLWAGGPSKKRPGYCGGNITTPDKDGKLPSDYHKEIYTAFKNGDDKLAHKLCEKLVGIQDGYGGYRCWGKLQFNFKKLRKESNYCRELNMQDGICTVSYNAKMGFSKSVTDKRIAFVSHPDKCGVVRLERKNAPLALSISLSSAHGKVEYSTDGFVHSGELEDNGLRLCMVAKVLTDGNVNANNKSIVIDNASEITIIYSADTDYMDSYPEYRTGESSQDLYSRVLEVVEKATQKGFDKLLEAHKEDFNSLYNRVEFSLDGSTDNSADTLLYNYSNDSGFRKKAIETLYNYGRYMMISSTRENDILPSNLQGIWNVSNSPMWQSDFHTNVNLQMNYWPAFNGNLAECAKPLIRYIKSMVEPGRISAKYYTGIESKDGEQNGFLFHTQCTPFGWTCPGWQFDWGWSPAAMPWILHNCFEHYEYTRDKETLKNDVYPMLKECAEYFSKLLVEHNGRLVTYPCYSPEHGPRTMGNTYEQALLYQLYNDATEAATVLGVDNDLIEKWQSIQGELRVYEIGEDSQVKEWYHETKLGEIGESHHRHMSHLLGLFPCNVMNWYNNPELIDAAKVSMNYRTDKSTGWSMGQKINSWARVKDGDRVLKIIGDLFKNGIYPNFFDYHPPFQIDGNFGFTSGVNEMLMQSHCGFIELLPALPEEWSKGSVRGLVARGNFTVSIEWEKGRLVSAEITSNNGEPCKIYYANSEFEIDGVAQGQDHMAQFDTVKGKTYTIKAI